MSPIQLLDDIPLYRAQLYIRKLPPHSGGSSFCLVVIKCWASSIVLSLNTVHNNIQSLNTIENNIQLLDTILVSEPSLREHIKLTKAQFGSNRRLGEVGNWLFEAGRGKVKKRERTLMPCRHLKTASPIGALKLGVALGIMLGSTSCSTSSSTSRGMLKSLRGERGAWSKLGSFKKTYHQT